MFHVTQLVGFGAGGAVPVTVLVRDATGDNQSATSRTVWTFSTMSIGTASATRRVICLVSGRSSTNSRTVSSATIGGISATIDIQTTASSSGSTVAAIIAATVPTGTTADVVVTFSGAMSEGDCYVTSLDNLVSVTPVDTAGVNQTSGNTITTGANVDWQAGGYVIAYTSNFTTGSTTTWTGATEYFDETPNGHMLSGAYGQPTSNATGQTITSDHTVNGSRQVLVVASYR